jgi:hypothetical protein
MSAIDKNPDFHGEIYVLHRFVRSMQRRAESDLALTRLTLAATVGVERNSVDDERQDLKEATMDLRDNSRCAQKKQLLGILQQSVTDCKRRVTGKSPNLMIYFRFPPELFQELNIKS